MHIVDSAGNSYKVDRLARATNTPRVRRFSFGDGYEQRLPNGINTLDQVFNVSFNNRPSTEINLLTDFFDSTAGVTSFAFSPPGSSSADCNVTFQQGPERISRNSGTVFTGLYEEDWITVTGSASNDGGYAIDSAESNGASLLYLYDSGISSESNVDVTIYHAIGVVCDAWSAAYPQEGIISVNATLRRVYEP